MGALDDFLQNKVSNSTSTGSSGSALSDFFDKKVKEGSASSSQTEITKPPEATKTPDTTISGDLGNGKPSFMTNRKPQKTADVVGGEYSNTNTTMQKNAIDKKQKDEEYRIKQADLVMGAQQLGHMFVEKLSPEDKDILIAGLKNKEASLAYKGETQKMSNIVGESISPTIQAPKETDMSIGEYAGSDMYKKLTQNEENTLMNPMDPQNPENFAFYEKQKRDKEMTFEGKKIEAYNKTAVDDPIENIDIALGIGRDQVMGTLGAIGEWTGLSDGSFRKEAENQQKWAQLDFNKPIDENNQSLMDSRYWTQKVPQMIPFMVALAPAGLAGAGVGSEVAAIAGLGKIGTYLTQSIFAGISSRTAEGFAEGAGVYAELKDQGVSDEEASQQAFDTTKQNMLLAISDIGQIALTFMPIKGFNELKKSGLASVAGKSLLTAGKLGIGGGSEGVEEAFQGYVSQMNVAQGLGKEPLSIMEYLQTDEAREAFKMGMAGGMMFGGVGVVKDAYDNFIDRAKEQVDMVDEAIEKNDIDFIPKMEVLEKKEAISRETVDAVKTLLDLNLKNQGSSYEEWMTNGLQARKEKIETITNKVEEVSKKVEEQKSQVELETEGKTFYHGSPNPNVKFQGAVDFTKDINTAKHFAEAKDRGGLQKGEIATVYEAKLDIKNPKIITKESEYNDIFQTTANKEIIPNLKEQGYDAIIYKPEDGGDIYYKVFSEEQIKTKPTESIKEPKTEYTPEYVKTLSDEDIQKNFTPEEIMQLDTENSTEAEQEIVKRYMTTVEAEMKQVDEENAQEGWMNDHISEESGITYKDMEDLAIKITRTLRDPKIKFGLKRGEDTSEMSTTVEKTIKTSTEATIEKLTEDFGTLRKGIKEIIEFYQKKKKHPYTIKKLQELQKIISGGQYDFLEYTEIFKNQLNPYLYGEKQIPRNVRKPIAKGTGESSTSSNADMIDGGQEMSEAGTGKKGIISALEEVNKAFPNITIEDISEKGMVVKGDTLPMKEQLKKAGGKWNPKYKGWIFPKTKRQMVQDLIDGNTTISDISTQKPAEKITGENVDTKRLKTDKEYQKKAYESVFKSGKQTDEKLYKIMGKELVPEGKETSSFLAELTKDKPAEKAPVAPKKKDTQKLRDIAAKVIEKAEAEIGRDRQENTGRRAGMADSARDRARREIEVAKMMEKYADMVDSGEKMNFNIDSKADMERMMAVFSRAEYMQEKEGGNIGKYIPDLFRVRIGTYRREIDSRPPSVWAKATRAGVKDLKNFMYGANETVNANRYEKEIEYIIKNASELGLNSYTAESMKKQLTDVKAYRKILNMNEDGEWNGPDILEQFQTMKNGAKVVESPEEALKRAERDIARTSNIPGFFPTPEDLVDRMIREASIDIGMRVLEPSAGIGSIADRIRNIGIEPEVGEYNSTLSEHLQKKGYKVVSEDFMQLPESEKYDRIIMNPPFENLQDVDHVMKAYDNLQEGGRIVAIMSESPFFRTDKKSTDFRDWLDTVGYSEKLPEGSFKDALKTTGVNTRIVIIDKPKTEAKVEIIEEVPEVVEKETNTPQFASIDTKIAMNASRGTSFDPEKRGLSRISGFKAEMEGIYNELLPYAKTEEQKAILNEEVSALSEKLATRQNAINSAEGGVVSSMIAGPARFPVARMQKRNEAIHKKNVEYTEFKERAMNSIKNKLKGQAIEEAGGPIEVLKKEIENLKKNQDLSKKINEAIRKFKTDELIRPELEKLGISEKTINDILTPYLGRKGIQSFTLTNLNNRIKDREAKLAKMEKMEALKGTEEATKALYEFEGGKVIDNRAEDRVQILFDEKPTKDQIQELKKRGWRWSPTNSAWQRFRNSGSVQNAREMFPEVDTKKFQSTKLTTKILNKLGDRETVSKEFIMNLTNSGDIKQVEKDIIRALLENEGEKINVEEFKVKVESELLPLTRISSLGGEPMYEQVVLSDDIRGDVQDYSENVYESPIKVNAGKVHFGEDAEKYFGHTRVEDMADGITRRIIEVQSDLYQRGRLEDEIKDINSGDKILLSNGKEGIYDYSSTTVEGKEYVMTDGTRFKKSEIKKIESVRGKEKLQQYNDPTAHFRMIREELTQASKDGIQKLQFPTGETAMKIEGLGSTSQFGDYELSSRIVDENPNIGMTALQQQARLTPENLEIGKKVQNGWNTMVVTEVLGDGKFRAIGEDTLRDLIKERNGLDIKGDLGKTTIDFAKEKIAGFRGMEEEFDISGKVDQNNPIYKFYEKEVGRYLKNNYNGKLVTDNKGVSWYEVEVTEDMQNQVLAFQNQKSDAWIYDIIGEKYGVKPFAQEKVDLKDVYLEAVQLAPEGWTVKIEDPTEANYLENVVAYADLGTKEIVISSTEARKSTAAHEAVHASLSELPEDQRKIIVDTARKQWEEETKNQLTDEQAEEFLAEEFKYYIENQKYKTKTIYGRLKEFLSKLWNTIKGLFGKDKKVKTFYEDILSGKIKRLETRVGKKFQSIQDKEKYDEIDAENFGYTLPPKLGIAYQKYKKEKTPSKVLTSFVEWGRRAFTPLDTAIGNISEKLRERMARFEYGVMNSEIVQQARPVMMKLSEKIKDKRETDDYRILDIALKNGDEEVVNFYAEKLGISEDLKEVRKILDTIHEEASKLGIDIKYLENYFPRTVNDSVGLLSYIYKTEYGSQIKEAIKLSEIQVGHDLTPDEKAVIANNMLRGYKIAGVTLTPPGNVKARTIKEVTKDIDPFYNDSMDSLAIYIQGMNENIEARKLFGKGDNLENSIGAYTMELLTNGEITPVQEVQLTKAIQARFASNPMDAWVQAYRGISYLTTMGSVVSALTQIQDLSFSLYENGFMKSGEAWIHAVTGNSKVTKEELGIHSIIQEFKEQGKIQGAVTKVFKMVGLEFMDRLGKETFVNAYYKKLQSEAMKGNMKGLEALGDRAPQAMEDLKAGKVTEDIKYILFARLCDFQPLTQSQMPEYYNTSGNMRVVYMLKTYTIKQIDVFRREAFAEIYEGSKMGGDRTRIIKGIKNLIFLVASLAMLGAGTDTLKNLLLNRPFSISDLVIDNMIKIMGFSKYTIYKVKEESVSAGLLSLVVPPFNFFNDVITDIGDVYSGDLTNPMEAQSINNIPVAGKLYYWWFGKGAIKSEKKRNAGSKKINIPVQKSKSGFSIKSGFSTKSGFSNKSGF